MKGYSLAPHPEANYTERHFAVIYSPRKKRDRFPAAVVTLFDTKEAAVNAQNQPQKLYAAEVVDPAKSSEGIHLFYLVVWF